MSYEIDLDDPFGSLIEQADRFLSGQKDTLIHTFAQTLGQILRPTTPNHDNVRGGSSGARFENQGADNNQKSRQKTHSRAPSSAPVPKESPRDVLGFAADAKLTRAMVKERQRTLAKLWHPDKGGSLKAIQRLNGAAQELLRDLK